MALRCTESRRGLTYQAFARLKDGVSIEQANANADAIGKALADSFPTDNRGRTFSLRPLSEGAIPPAFQQQLVLSGTIGMVVTGLVLLIACANVANLLMARASARRQEIAVRLSIGANRARLIRQLLTESALLAAAGGIGGIVVAYWARALLWAFRPPFMQEGAIDLSFDPRVLAFSAAVSMITGLLFGLAPAFQSSRPDLVTELKERTQQSGGSHWYNVRHVLVIGQVALSLVALVSAGLFVRSLANAQQINLGFDGEPLIVLGMNAGTQGFNESRGRDLYRRVQERLAGVPGVKSATLANAVPMFAGGFSRTTFKDDQDTKDPRNGRLTQVGEVGNRYFETMGIPIVRGRAFDATDRQGSTPVIIVNEAMAKQFFPNEDPLGRHLTMFNFGTAREIVGIAKTIKVNSVGETDTAYMYIPLEQNYAAQITVVVRAAGEPEAVLGTVRKELQQVEPAMPLLNVNTYRSVHQHLSLGAAHGRVATGGVRHAGAGARGHRSLRRDGVQRESANAGDRHPHGAWCRQRHRAEHGRAPGAVAGARRRRHRPHHRAVVVATGDQPLVRHHRRRSGDVCRRRPAAAHRRGHRDLPPCMEGESRRSGGRPPTIAVESRCRVPGARCLVPRLGPPVWRTAEAGNRFERNYRIFTSALLSLDCLA